MDEAAKPPSRSAKSHVPLLKQLGPGFITGAADDDPSTAVMFLAVVAMLVLL